MPVARAQVVLGALVATTLVLFVSVEPAEVPKPVPAVSRPRVSDRSAVPAASTGAQGRVLPPFKCATKPVDMHRPRDNSSVSWSPSGRVCCGAVKNDIDRGLTLYHFLTRYLCAVAPADGRPLRIVQVGANSGDNANDHVVTFLRQRWADAVLLEPVPWLFRKLQQTYAEHKDHISLVNAAVTGSDGVVPFVAPKKGASGWVTQMGGVGALTRKNYETLRKRKELHLIEQVNVSSVSMRSVLAMRGWGGELPDLVVIDTEGFDANIVAMLLDTIQESGARHRLHGSVIPFIQYEWKHLERAVDDKVVQRLRGLGYCVSRVHYDTVAYDASLENSWPAKCSDGFAVAAA